MENPFRRLFKEQPFSTEHPTVIGPALVMQYSGPLMTVDIWNPDQADFLGPVSGIALIDTGANLSAIDRSLVQRLNLQRTGVEKTIRGSDGQRSVHPTYRVRFSFPGTRLPDYETREAAEQGLAASQPFIPADMKGEFIGLLGRDFLRFYLLTYNGHTAEFTLTPQVEGVALDQISRRDPSAPSP